LKIILTAFLLFFAARVSYSDQLAWITKEQAEKTVAYFSDKEIERVLLWCACCDNDSKMIVNIEHITYKKADDPAYYQIYIEGSTTKGKIINQAVDLAYVHIKRGGKWRCLGKELGFECDPCTKDFKL
jgi:hypothetical protein